jgi:hypothetical protein
LCLTRSISISLLTPFSGVVGACSASRAGILKRRFSDCGREQKRQPAHGNCLHTNGHFLADYPDRWAPPLVRKICAISQKAGTRDRLEHFQFLFFYQAHACKFDHRARTIAVAYPARHHLDQRRQGGQLARYYPGCGNEPGCHRISNTVPKPLTPPSEVVP